VRRTAIDCYSMAAEDAHHAADALLSADSAEKADQLAADLAHARVRLYDLQNLLDDISDDVFTEEEAIVQLDRPQRAALDVAIDRALHEPDL
jgi:hypothetical protein